MGKKLFALIAAILSVATIIGLFNILTDPVGVFGDKLLNWYSYNMTNNPRVAKTVYLEKNNKLYDSYIIGCSSTSSFPAEQLGEYLDASFYNLIMYGADMEDAELTINYLADNYTVKNIVLNVFLSNGDTYATEVSDTLYNLHYKVNGENPFYFYSRYLFLNPSYGINKLKDIANDTYLQQKFDVFNVETGAYDKRKRDAERIADTESYLSDYPEFVNYNSYAIGLSNTDKCMESVKRIKDKCQSMGINLIVVSGPVYIDHFKCFDKASALDFYRKLAQVTDYWDFSISSVSCEPRFFYDSTHFRNCVGKMAVARIFNDTSVYVPEDFGVYVTKQNVEEHLKSFDNVKNMTESVAVPILMYHHLTEDAKSTTEITPESFEEQLALMRDMGYTSILFSDLFDYVEKGIDLPEKPVVITFDDGYLSNYTLAFPLLQKYNMKATMFVIGSSVGDTHYKNTDIEITPHFTYEQAKEMQQSGLVDIQSHTYDMHMWHEYEKDKENVRANILPIEGEREESYLAALREDISKTNSDFSEHLGKTATVLSYPGGYCDTMAQTFLMENGIKATLATSNNKNIIVKGLPQSLIMLNRHNISEHTNIEKFKTKIS